jgi:hypothetical protein
MKIKNKLIIAFIIVGILPMMIGVYLSVAISQRILNQESQTRLANAEEIIHLRENQLYFNRGLHSLRRYHHPEKPVYLESGTGSPANGRIRHSIQSQ